MSILDKIIFTLVFSCWIVVVVAAAQLVISTLMDRDQEVGAGTIRRLLDRLFPGRLQERVSLDNEQLRELWARVYPEDPCLRAVEELLGRQLLESATTAGNLNVSAEIKLRACERMECARVLLLLIEEHREQAKAWRDEQEKLKG